ncbi:ester cyclase [Alphaproteobacteria bacterium]|jgi:hypothetical protein|nr:ester cyclase [Alphaproteobacteria bacterium]
MQHEDVVETWFRRVWNEEDASAIDEMFEGAGRAVGLGGSGMQQGVDFRDHELIGPEGFKFFHQSLLGLVGSVTISVTDSMTRGDWIAALCMLNGKCRKTGADAQMSGQVYMRLANDQIVEAYNHWDFISLFAELGLLPKDTLMQCLSGKRVA